MSITFELSEVLEWRRRLDFEDAGRLMRKILAGEADDLEVAALLGAMAGRGESAEEIAGFATAMREAATTLPLNEAEQRKLVDTCGTGGDSSGTFNISTAAALVASSAGARVAKHGNRAVTSQCGSADVLEALGIPVNLEPQAAADALREHGFVFMLAPNHHPAMRALLPVRRALKVRTVLHVMGPLLNPAGARRQVMGVYAPGLVRPVADAMTKLGIEHAFVVHGFGRLDELALSGPSRVAEVRRLGDQVTVGEYEVAPETVGMTRVPVASLRGGGAQENAATLRAVFAGEAGPKRDVVVLNAAAVLVAAGVAADLTEGVSAAADAIDTGRTAELIARLAGK